MGKFKKPQLIDFVGTPAWIRTKDQLIKSQLLYQLSYRGVAWREDRNGSVYTGDGERIYRYGREGNRKILSGW